MYKDTETSHPSAAVHTTGNCTVYNPVDVHELPMDSAVSKVHSLGSTLQPECAYAS